MIEKRHIDGRPATIVYLRAADFAPATPSTADLVKIIFDDGEVAFLTPRTELAESLGKGCDASTRGRTALSPRPGSERNQV